MIMSWGLICGEMKARRNSGRPGSRLQFRPDELPRNSYVLKLWLIVGSLAATATVGAPVGATATTQEYKGLDLAPDGKRLAAVEPIAAGLSETEPRGPVVVRGVDNGLIVDRLDSCHRCRYSGLAW